MLEKYREKRNFDVTPEPGGTIAHGTQKLLTFVVQKHAARNLHYDFRLELDGVLLSWAVPKGPSLDPKIKRMAVHVEDHPLAYATFEGTIPEGNYGAGKVIVWDEGVYRPDYESETREEMQQIMREGMAKGKLSITMYGTKMHGSWTLVKTHGKQKDGWLLIKHEDEFASSTRDILEDSESVRSKFSLDDEPKKAPSLPACAAEAPEAPVPSAVTPMFATELDQPFDRKGWLFEVKLDGIRVIGILERGVARLLSRNGKDITKQYPEIAAGVQALPYRSAVVDGEIVIFGPDGKPSFQALMDRFHVQNPVVIDERMRTTPGQLFVFDLLYLEGRDLRGLPLSDRRECLEGLVLAPPLKLVDSIPNEGKLLYDHATKVGFEGIMGKNAKSPYREGVRSPDWVKVKETKADEFTIAGYTPGDGARKSAFGALVLMHRGEKEGIYAGNVGGGFSDGMLDEVKQMLDSIKTDKPAIKDRSAIPEVGKVTWVEPKHVAEVKYMALTRDGRLRFPVFLRWRPDLAPVSESSPAVPEASVEIPSAVDEVSRVLKQLDEGKKEIMLQVEGHSFKVSNLDRVVWPGTEHAPPGTKRDHLRYLALISSFLLPHLKDRPITLTRYPNGAEGDWFFQKHLEKMPSFIRMVDVYSKHNNRARDLIMVDNLATLMWSGQMASIELHPWYSRVAPSLENPELGFDFSTSEETLDASALNYPDFMVVDLDPYKYAGTEKPGEEPAYNPEAFRDACEVALEVKKVLDQLGAAPYLKTSGKTGLHLFIPIQRTLDYDQVRAMAMTIGSHIAAMMPKRVTLEWAVDKRTGMVFFDYNQNSRGKTLASVYSPRPTKAGTVSFPVSFEGLLDIDPFTYTIHNVPGILAEQGDAWANILYERKKLG